MSKVVIVNKQGKFVKEEEFKIALDKGLIRNIVRIFVFNTKGELFLQKRSNLVAIFPGRWDSSAAGHVDPGETPLQAAKKEVHEELGVEKISLKEMMQYYNEEQWNDITLRSYDTVFTAVYNGKFNWQNWEVNDGKWFAIQEITKMIKHEPQQFSSGFVNAFWRYLQYVNKTKHEWTQQLKKVNF